MTRPLPAVRRFGRPLRLLVAAGLLAGAAALPERSVAADPPVFPSPSTWPTEVTNLAPPFYKPGLTPSSTPGYAVAPDAPTLLLLNTRRESDRIDLSVVNLLNGATLFQQQAVTIPNTAGFSPTGNIVTLLQPDAFRSTARVRLINGFTGEEFLNLQVGGISRLTWSYDASRLLVLDTQGNAVSRLTVLRADGTTAFKVENLRTPSYAVDPSSRRLAIVDRPQAGKVRLQYLRLDTGASLLTVQQTILNNVGFSPTGDRLIFNGTDRADRGQVRMVDLDGATVLTQNVLNLDSLGFSGDGAILAIVNRVNPNRGVALYQTSNGTRLFGFVIGPPPRRPSPPPPPPAP